MSTNPLTREIIERTIPPPHRGVYKIARYLQGGGGGGPTPGASSTFGTFFLPFGESAIRFGYAAIEAAGFVGSGRGGTRYIPDEGWDPVAKTVIADIINAVGGGVLEQGVYDRPQPVLYPVFPGPSTDETSVYQIPSQVDEPVYLPTWPDEWKKKPGEEPGWNDDDWVYPKEEPVAFWDGISAVVDIIQGQTPGGNLVGGPTQMAYAPMGAAVPDSFPAAAGGKVTVDTKTGKVTACRRRRRRRLLTPTDLNDLAALKTIVGGGQAINFAVMKAVRR